MLTIKEARIAAHYSMDQMAVYIGVSRPTYGLIEQDPSRMTLGQLKRFCETAGVRASSLFLPIDLTNV